MTGVAGRAHKAEKRQQTPIALPPEGQIFYNNLK